MGEPGAAFIPTVVDSAKKKKRQKKEKDEEEDTTKALMAWAEQTEDKVKSDIKKLYEKE